jgi:hypothetical protein
MQRARHRNCSILHWARTILRVRARFGGGLKGYAVEKG